MYGSDDNLGCLQGSIERVGKGLNGNISRLGKGLRGGVERIGRGQSGNIGLVCYSDRDAYLRISTDTIWLTPDVISEEFDIISNVVWIIN